MFALTNKEKIDLLNNVYDIFNSHTGRILFRVLIERFSDLQKVCIEAGYDFNTGKISEKVCRAIIQEMLNVK